MFTMYTICAYNKNIGSLLLVDCACYTQYKKAEKFRELLDNRKSYMGCLTYVSLKRNRINHMSVPIMLGSKLDYLIRGEEECLKTYVQWGCFC